MEGLNAWVDGLFKEFSGALAWLVYLSVNLVGGTFVSLPMHEKLLAPAVKGGHELNLLADAVSLKVVFVWYLIGGAILSLLFLGKLSKRPSPLIPAVATMVWMGSAVHFRLVFQAQWDCFLTAWYLATTLAVAVVTQVLAVQAVEPLLGVSSIVVSRR